MSTSNIADRPMNDFEKLQTRLQAVRNAADCSLCVRRYLEWSKMEPNVPCPATKPTVPTTGRSFFDRILV